MNVYDIIKESYNTDDEIIEEGLFNKNPYKKIIKKYKKDYTIYQYDSEKVLEKEISKIKKDIDNLLKDVEEYKSFEPQANSRNAEITYQWSYDVKSANTKVYNRIKKYVPKFTSGIFSYDNGLNAVDDVNAEAYITAAAISLLYCDEDAKINNIPTTLIKNIIDKFSDIVEFGKSTKGYVSFKKIIPSNTDTKKFDKRMEELEKLLSNNVYYSTSYRLYIFNPKIINKNIKESYYDEDELHDNNLLKEENTMSMTMLANLARDAGLENLLIESDIIKEYDQVIDSLDTISKSKIAGDISVLPVYESDKSYYTDLETLYTVSEVYDVELNEAMKLLKEVNDLSEDINISVALKEGFENYTTLEEFVELKEALNEAGIDLAWNKELSDEDFITEAGKISDAFSKVKDKIKNMNINSLEKTIKKCEESNKKLNEELQKVQKMSKEEADKYAKKQSAKNIAIVSAAAVSAGMAGGYSGVLIASNMLVGIPVYAGVFTAASKLGTKLQQGGKGLVGFNSTTYKKAIKNTIKINNKTIKQCNTALKSKK